MTFRIRSPLDYTESIGLQAFVCFRNWQQLFFFFLNVFENFEKIPGNICREVLCNKKLLGSRCFLLLFREFLKIFRKAFT